MYSSKKANEELGWIPRKLDDIVRDTLALKFREKLIEQAIDAKSK